MDVVLTIQVWVLLFDQCLLSLLPLFDPGNCHYSAINDILCIWLRKCIIEPHIYCIQHFIFVDLGFNSSIIDPPLIIPYCLIRGYHLTIIVSYIITIWGVSPTVINHGPMVMSAWHSCSWLEQCETNPGRLMISSGMKNYPSYLGDCDTPRTGESRTKPTSCSMEWWRDSPQYGAHGRYSYSSWGLYTTKRISGGLRVLHVTLIEAVHSELAHLCALSSLAACWGPMNAWCEC